LPVREGRKFGKEYSGKKKGDAAPGCRVAGSNHSAFTARGNQEQRGKKGGNYIERPPVTSAPESEHGVETRSTRRKKSTAVANSSFAKKEEGMKKVWKKNRKSKKKGEQHVRPSRL